MKNVYLIIIIIFLSLNAVFGQKIAQHTITNFSVNTSTNKFSFDIYSQRTGTTFIRVGVTNYLIVFNNSGLNTPILSNINPKYTVGSPTGDYDAMTVETSFGNQVNVTIRYTGSTSGTGDLLSTTGPMGELICTVTLNIINQNTIAMVSWNTNDSQMLDANILQPVTNNYQGAYNGSLPIELSTFTGKVVNGTKVNLKWETKTEVNNYGFNVERRIKDGEWNKIGFVEGSGTSNSPKNYSYTDNDIFAGGSKLQYRLKQVDTDGQFDYSDIVEVTLVPTQFELSQNYPNPFNPSTTIRFSLPTETKLKINIYNMLGELVQTLADGNYEAGYHKVTFNASALPSGAYIYRIESGEFVQVRKMILLK